MKKFNVGEAVYYPRATNKVLRLKDTNKSLTTRDLQVELGNIGGGIPATFYKNGVHLNHGKAQEIFHATQENYELLSQLYPNVTFEPPTNQKEPREIIKALLDDGNSGVLCWVSNYYHEPSYNNSKAQIVTVVNDDDFYCSGCSFVKYATPIIPIKTFNQKIIDFVNDEVVLE